MPSHVRRRAFALVALAAALLAFAAPAHASARTLRPGDHGAAVKALQRALGLHADGVYGAGTTRAVRRVQRRAHLRVDGVARPATLRALGLGSGGAQPQAGPGLVGTGGAQAGTGARAADDDGSGASGSGADAGAAPSGDVAATLARIARCESGGDPTAVSPDGRYRGKYQFTRSTWRSLGGAGDPAAAPEAEQDRRAADLYEREGARPWPTCGRA